MISPYYSQQGITIYHGDAREIVPLVSFDSIVMDPPYGENMGYAGDAGYFEAVPLLHAVLQASVEKLPRCGHVAFFWTMRGLDQAIDTLRSCGLTYRRLLSMYLPKGSARPYLAWLPRTQPILLAQKYLPTQPMDFHAALAEHLDERIRASGLTRSEIARQLGCDSRLVMKWSRVGDPAWCLPTPRFYPALKKLLNVDDQWDILVDRRPDDEDGNYEYRHDCYVVNDSPEDRANHPSSKPLEVVSHLVKTLAKGSKTVCDPFMGSGTTLLAAKALGCPAIGIEIDETYCESAAKELDHTEAGCASAVVRRGSGQLDLRNALARQGR